MKNRENKSRIKLTRALTICGLFSGAAVMTHDIISSPLPSFSYVSLLIELTAGGWFLGKSLDLLQAYIGNLINDLKSSAHQFQGLTQDELTQFDDVSDVSYQVSFR